MARAVVLIACMLSWPVRVEAADEPARTPSVSWIEAFPELAAAYQPIDRFLSSNTIFAGKADPATTDDARRSWNPFPAGTRIVAFEENDHFICATGEARGIDASHNRRGEAAMVRRFVLLKPSLFVLDDSVRPPGLARSLRWQLHCRHAPTVAGRRLRVADGDQDLVCQALWPANANFEHRPGAPDAKEPVYPIEAESPADADGLRWLHVMELREAGDAATAVESAVENHAGTLALTIRTADRTFRLSLPPPGAGAGRIAIEAADGETILARRPLPSGVLPHGPQGRALIERWDRAYRRGRRPGWDPGVPAKALTQVIEQGVVRPCRTAVLGCGAGTNAIYLASKGFDVTAIDVAPTALHVAEAKAEEAGVRVEWVLADVLVLPELEPFEFIFDRGCYHNVRYVDAAAFVESLRRLSRPGTRVLVLSLNRDGPPGIREHHMRDDFSALFEFEWLRDSGIHTGREGKTVRESWSLMLRRK
jgi:SAM-dependent methyltransferase